MDLWHIILLTLSGTLLIGIYLITCFYVCGLSPNKKETLQQISCRYELTEIRVDNRRVQNQHICQNIQIAEKVQGDKCSNIESTPQIQIHEEKLPFAEKVKLEA
jgi:hypothetical protein